MSSNFCHVVKIKILKAVTSHNKDNHTAFVIHITEVVGKPKAAPSAVKINEASDSADDDYPMAQLSVNTKKPVLKQTMEQPDTKPRKAESGLRFNSWIMAAFVFIAIVACFYFFKPAPAPAPSAPTDDNPIEVPTPSDPENEMVQAAAVASSVLPSTQPQTSPGKSARKDKNGNNDNKGDKGKKSERKPATSVEQNKPQPESNPPKNNQGPAVTNPTETTLPASYMNGLKDKVDKQKTIDALNKNNPNSPKKGEAEGVVTSD